MSEIAKPSPFLRESSIADLALTDRWAGAEFTAAREAAWYRHHTHLVIEMQEGRVGGSACPVTAVVRDFETYFRTPYGQIRDSGLPSNCHQRSQIQANASKRSQQTEAAIQLISFGKVRERFLPLGGIWITNRLLYH